MARTAAWQRKEGKSKSGGLNRKGIASYRAANPGSKLSMAVTTKPSKLKKGSKAANRRKSFCSRMKGMKAKLTSAKTARDVPSLRFKRGQRNTKQAIARVDRSTFAHFARISDNIHPLNCSTFTLSLTLEICSLLYDKVQKCA